MVGSPGGRILIERINEQIREGWDEFIKLPVSEKTGKAAFNFQAKYEVLRNLKTWIDDEIRCGKE